MVESFRKFIRGSVFWILILGFIFYINYYVDSYAMLRTSYDEIGQKLNEGYNVTGLSESRYDERKMLMSFIESNSNKIDNIIIGSSRSMLFHENQICNGTFRNYGSSGGCLDDYYNVLGYLKYQNQMPEKVILEINGSLFFSQDGRAVYMQEGKRYLTALMNGGDTDIIYPEGRGVDFTKLWDLDYFKSNLNDWKNGRQRFFVEYTNEVVNDQGTKLSDGSTLYGKETREVSVENVAAATDRAVENHNVYKVDGFTELNTEYIDEFEYLIDYLLKENIAVELYLPPYTEPVYAMMRDNLSEYAGVFETEEYILNFCKGKKVALYGSFNPNYCNLQLDEMYDTFHVKDEYMLKTYFLREL